MQSPRLVKKLKENKMADQPQAREPLTARSALDEKPDVLGAREALRQSAARRQFDEANRLIGATPAPSTSEKPLGPATAPSPEKAEGGSDPNKKSEPNKARPSQKEIPVLEMPNPQLDTVFENRPRAGGDYEGRTGRRYKDLVFYEDDEGKRRPMTFYEAIMMRRRREQE